MTHPNEYTVGYICSIQTEYLAAVASLEKRYDGMDFVSRHDTNDYTFGKVGKHNVVIAISPKRDWGLSTTAVVATHMQRSFPGVSFILVISAGGGAPSERHDIRLGDIVVGTSRGSEGAVILYDVGKSIQDEGFTPRRIFMEPPATLQSAVNKLKDRYRSGHRLEEIINVILEKNPMMEAEYRRPHPDSDTLYNSYYTHSDPESSCRAVCEYSEHSVLRRSRADYTSSPIVQYGTIASGDKVIKDAFFRDRLAIQQEVLCFDAGSAGVMHNIPCLAICGICNYSDTHRTPEWNGYAALAAAAYAKDLLSGIELRNNESGTKSIGIRFGEAAIQEETDQPYTYEDYKIGVICAIEFEMSAIRYMLDKEHKRLKRKPGESTIYVLGELEGHNVVLACLPGNQGKGAAAAVAKDMARTFTSIGLRLMVGIGGGVPSKKNDIRLGDVVVSMPDGQSSGVVQYDLGKNTNEGLTLKGFLWPPPAILRSAVGIMRSDHRISQSKVPEFLSAMFDKSDRIRESYQRPPADLDQLFDTGYLHETRYETCVQCEEAKTIGRPNREPVSEIHYGLIASGDQVIRNATFAAEIQAKVVGDILCFEMEAAGILTELPCIVIRGISDYADSHKNDVWQHYAAAAAAGCAKELLSYLSPD